MPRAHGRISQSNSEVADAGGAGGGPVMKRRKSEAFFSRSWARFSFISCSICGTARPSSNMVHPNRCPACATRWRKPMRCMASKWAWYFKLSMTTSAPSAKQEAKDASAVFAPFSSGLSSLGFRRIRTIVFSSGLKGSPSKPSPASWKTCAAVMEPRKPRWNKPRYRGFPSKSRKSPDKSTTSTPPSSKAGVRGGHSFFGFLRPRPLVCWAAASGCSSVTSSILLSCCMPCNGEEYGKTCSSGISGGRCVSSPVSI
mmetsp:Transcript_117837/g.293891  ORF Transcript_117837/g.293891 Transcript_117837/m.293891 type:complete len:256 (+) Transcript_117837:91-858(+)